MTKWCQLGPRAAEHRLKWHVSGGECCLAVVAELAPCMLRRHAKSIDREFRRGTVQLIMTQVTGSPGKTTSLLLRSPEDLLALDLLVCEFGEQPAKAAEISYRRKYD